MQYLKQSLMAHACKAINNAGVIGFIIACCIVVVNAQTGSSGTTETRARRAQGAGSASKTDQPKAQSTPSETGSNFEPVKPIEDPEPVTSRATLDTAKQDRIEILRAQIMDAKSDVERVRLQRTLVDYLMALGRKAEAATELRSMLGTENLDAATYYNIANGLARLEEQEAAVGAYRKAIDARQGNYPKALNNMGVVLLDLGRLDEAYDAFVLAIKQQNFRYAEASYNLGILYAKRGEADLAISEWTRALKVQADHVDAAVSLALAYAATGQPGRGLEVIDKALKRTGSNARLEETREKIAAMDSGK